MSDGNGTALAETAPTAIYRSPVPDFTSDQIALVKRTICKPKRRDATNDELAMFIGQAKRTGLDPFARQIYAIFRWSSQDNAEVMTVQTGIDGFRVIAERSRAYLGQLGPYWCGADGVWHEIWNESKPPVAAKVIVRKAVGPHIAETPAVAHWAEYVPLKNGKPMGLWPTKGVLMIAKCAEALALRKAFPNDLSGLYIEEELQKPGAGDPAAVPVLTAEPPAEQTAGMDTANGSLVTAKRAKELVDIAFDLGLEGKLQLALANVTGEDVGDCSTKKAATEMVRGLHDGQADKIESWLNRKADEAAAANV